jgi:zinc protease
MRQAVRHVPRALAVLLLAVACRAAAPPVTEPLPVDPRLVTGELANGLRYVVRRHPNPAGRLALWLHVHSGSLNETDATRGLAHFLEHMAFNGSTHFPPGAVIPFFQSLGMSFGRDQNAFTGFDQTTYTLALPATDPATLDKGLTFLADVAGGLSFPESEIETERQVVLEEKRARASAQQRVQDHVLERLAAGSVIGRRLPIGAEETIRSVRREDFLAYYRRWYVPSNITLLAVGDVEPETVVAAARARLGAGPRLPRPPPRPTGVQPTRGRRAIVATDPELTRAEVSIVRVEPPPGPVRTVAGWRERLVERLGTLAFDRRMSQRLAEGSVAFLQADASVREWGQAMRVITVEAAGRPEAWPRMLADLGEALQQARRHGFSAREIEDAGRILLAQHEEAARQDETRPARAVIAQINRAVTREEPIMSAAQELELLRRLLPGVSAGEVSAAFTRLFDPSHAIFVAELPADAGAPGEAQLLAAGAAGVAVEPGPPIEVARAERLMAAPPAAGPVLEPGEHAATGVTSAWLSNGVRVHHRRLTERRHEVSVVISLAGGQIQETAATRGIARAAVAAWDRPATSRLASTQIRDLMTGKRVRVSGAAGDDSVALVVQGDPADLESGLQLAHLLLTDPVLEPAAFAQWRDAELTRLAARRTEPRAVLADALAEALYPPGEARLRPLTAAQVAALGRDAAQTWLRELVSRAPVEVAMVGDLDAAAALRLAATYLGSLPPRERIGPAVLAPLRRVPLPAGPIRAERTVPTRSPQAVVLEGFLGPDIQAVQDVRRLILAGRVLTTRMTREIREQKGLVYSIGAWLQPGREYPGFGLFSAQAPTDPAKAATLAAAVEAMYLDFAARGPTAEELAVARRQTLNVLDEALRTPDFWTGRLTTLDYRGLRLDDISGAAAAYEATTAAEVREAFARYFRPEARVRIVVLPRPPE